MDVQQKFIGTGWRFPPAFDRATGSVLMASGVEDIVQSLNILISTSLGERVMRPDYGCRLHDYVFDPMNVAMQAYLKKLVEDAIIYFEPRITLDDCRVEFEQMEGRLMIYIDFTIDATNSRANHVYPYYIQEGTNLSV
ncbi:MAG TPA: GPW/gp25 family protein [Phnomibacter sp.]|nr:GPW/gp25 family protein [Phnomibacter sp.]